MVVGKNLSAKDRLKAWRASGERRPAEVVSLAEPLVNSATSRAALGDDVWSVYEQLFVAALDCGRGELADRCLGALRERFPQSVRVKRLVGMQLESVERFGEAEALYAEVLAEEPTNASVLKRAVATKRMQGKTAAAIKLLNEYLHVFMVDPEAWLELADLYLGAQMYDMAAHCFEELVLLTPHNHLHHTRLAEVRYTAASAGGGRPDDLVVARQHFAKAHDLNPDSARALYGLFMASVALLSAKQGAGRVGDTNRRLVELAAVQLVALYKRRNASPEALNALRKFIDAHQVSG